MATGRVDDIYEQLKTMAVTFQLRPGDKLNEVALAKELGASRTPLREALNRLVSEKLFDFKAGQGFFCRSFDAQSIFDLYEMRRIVEVAAAQIACARATDEQLSALRDALYATGLETQGLTVADACARDEAFHMGIAELTGNAVLVLQLRRINERIRYVRWVQMSQPRLVRSKNEHKRIMEALLARDAATAGQVVEEHIGKRMDQIVEAVRAGITSIYMDDTEAMISRIVKEA